MPLHDPYTPFEGDPMLLQGQFCQLHSFRSASLGSSDYTGDICAIV